MKISRDMLSHYLSAVTVSFFNDQDEPPDELSGYRDVVMALQYQASKHGDMDCLRLGLGYLLCAPGIDYQQWSGSRYPFDPEEVRAIIEYIYKTLWPGEPLPSKDRLAQVELVRMPIMEWWAERGRI